MMPGFYARILGDYFLHLSAKYKRLVRVGNTNLTRYIMYVSFVRETGGGSLYDVVRMHHQQRVILQLLLLLLTLGARLERRGL